MTAFLGVDIGTSSSKGVLVDGDGRLLATAVREHDVCRPYPGHVEMDGELWWAEFRDLATELTAAVPGATVAAVGVSGMGPCVLLTDEHGTPLRPAILYGVDTRATAQIDALTAELGGADAILEACGSVLSTQAVGPKLRWVAEHEPQVWARARRLFMPASWLAYKLTGQYTVDVHSASQCTPMFDRHAVGWHTAWAGPVAGDLELPPLFWSDEIVGVTREPVAGIAAGVPVVAGTIDAWAEAVSADAQNPGDLMLMYGTTMFLIATGAEPLTSPSMWGTAGAFRGSRNLAGGMATSGALTAWLRDLTGAGYADLIAEAEQSGPGARGLLTLPYFAGERTPLMDPDARGLIAGLTVGHTRGDLYRAALEATALGVRHNVEVLRAAGAGVDRVVAVGGGTRGGLWTRIVSDVTGLVQVVPTITIGASYGAAYLAARATTGADIATWNPPAHTVEPDPANRAGYDELYALYRDLYPATRTTVHALAARQRAAAEPPPARERAAPEPSAARERAATDRPSGGVTVTYAFPAPSERPAAEPNTAYLIASGDLRPSANIAGWPTQERMEAAVTAVFADLGWTVKRAHAFDPDAGHGFISSQRMGIEVFKRIPPEAPLIVAEAVWQYSHHVLAGLRTHRGPILTVANFAGDWPGLVGLLGVNAGMAKMGVEYSTIWSVDFTDDWFRNGIRSWVETGRIEHDQSHVRDLPALDDGPERDLGVALARQLRDDKAIIGVFDEGCMGMYNAIIDDELLNPTGIYKERLSQSALWAEMRRVPDAEADAVGEWLRAKGMTFRLGTDEATELTEAQLRWQYKMYIAALRISDDFGLDAVGIQYQQGLKDLSPASDLAEGLLNNADRPPVTSRDGSRVLWDGVPLPHFNEVDEGVAVDSLVTNRIWTAMGLDPATTLHDVRWGEEYDGRFVWVWEISGSVPPSHLDGGYAGAVGWRQDPVYFPLGGSTIKGVCRPGAVVWSRVFVQGGALHVDLGRATAVELPAEETERRSKATTPAWPIMHAVLHGIDRNQFMARHKANHLNVAYAPDDETADRALAVKAALFAELGVHVHYCGV